MREHIEHVRACAICGGHVGATDLVIHLLMQWQDGQSGTTRIHARCIVPHLHLDATGFLRVDDISPDGEITSSSPRPLPNERLELTGRPAS
jgi:hypothetical protein